MPNPFKKILQNEKLSKSMKEKVMEDIHLMKLTIDMSDLFLIKYPDTVNEMINIKNNKDEK